MKTAVISILLIFSSHLAMAGNNMEAHAKGAVELGWQNFVNGDNETALKRFNQARILEPDFAPSYFGTAYVLSTENKLEEAIGYYRKTIELAPSFPHAHSNLGLALLYSGKNEEAHGSLQRALKLAPDDGDVNVNMAVWYFENHRYEEAWQHVKVARVAGTKIEPSFLEELSQQMAEPK